MYKFITGDKIVTDGGYTFIYTVNHEVVDENLIICNHDNREDYTVETYIDEIDYLIRNDTVVYVDL